MDLDTNNKIKASDKMETTFQEKNKDDTHNMHLKNVHDDTTTDEKKQKKKITIVVDEDDPCLKQEAEEKAESLHESPSIGEDPRFQQQNQTLRCWVMYTDFYRCERILGTGSSACTWFKDVFTAMCPKNWVSQWDQLRVEGKLPWHKHRTQGNFPGDKYGV